MVVVFVIVIVVVAVLVIVVVVVIVVVINTQKTSMQNMRQLRSFGTALQMSCFRFFVSVSFLSPDLVVESDNSIFNALSLKVSRSQLRTLVLAQHINGYFSSIVFQTYSQAGLHLEYI